MSVNKVTLLGNIVRDPEIRQFDNGGKIAVFSVATNERAFKTADGKEIPERTEYHNIVVRNKLAEIAATYLKKGNKIYLEGMLRTRQYKTANEEIKYTTEIYASTFEMLTPRASGSPETGTAPADIPTSHSDDDDLPF